MSAEEEGGQLQQESRLRVEDQRGGGGGGSHRHMGSLGGQDSKLVGNEELGEAPQRNMERAKAGLEIGSW